tara:strand:- start:250 stop:582 length:333 start_codon:yes stop_codon:yes gene_type:complete
MDSATLLDTVQTVKRCFIERNNLIKSLNYCQPDFSELQRVADELAKSSAILLNADTGIRCGMNGDSQNGPQWFRDFVIEYGQTAERKPFTKYLAKATRERRRARIASLDA